MNQELRIKNTKKGLTLIELLFGMAFIAFMGLAIANFQNSMFSSSEYLQRSLMAEGDARTVLRQLISELRAMNYSSVGSYPISSALENSITFYSDTNGDGNPERLRYFLDGDLFKVGVVYPSGAPLTYDINSERIKTLVRKVDPTASIFTYHGTEYTGENGALVFPVDIPLIRLVKVNIPIIIENQGTTTPYSISSQVSLRNLKENL
ncbi:MAG TPA: hypothetical protein P5056_01570 [Candidatus Paceibacterota bacterium]|nr:hypothetical protein [Candidatus Paceibacterota bacterium]